MTELYTSSRLRVLRTCPRKHYYRYTLGLRTRETPEMVFGTVGHAALEAWYRAWQRDELAARLPDALAVIDAAAVSDWDRIKLRLLIIAYDERWGTDDWDVLAVEVEFRYLLGDYMIGGKLDAVIRDRRDQCTYIVEHKFAGGDTSIGSPYWERLAIDTQVSIYIDGGAMLGFDIAGCIYDVVKRPEHEQLLATPADKRKYTTGRGCKRCGGSAKAGAIARGRGTYSVAFASEVKLVPCGECAGTGWKLDQAGVPEAPRLYAQHREDDETRDEFEDRLLAIIAENSNDFLMRGPVVRLEHELPRMRTDLIEWIELERTGLAPRNDNACSSFGRLCEFFPICAGRESPDDEIRFPRGPAHPELATAA